LWVAWGRAADLPGWRREFAAGGVVRGAEFVEADDGVTGFGAGAGAGAKELRITNYELGSSDNS
ncbi:MAG: hypothetical protein HZB26_03465, partial [Candidatus Hydrogenedentes bacterium]|nr:hypothetical protein [Candidatus Hydrogenedentota bacterium]